MKFLDQLQFGFARRMPVILQTEAAECSLACLAMVASFHCRHAGLAEVRKLFSLSLKGATLAHLMQAATKLDLIGRPLRLDLEHLVELKTPCVLHWDLNHFVVLKQVGRSHVVIHDPAIGVRRLSLEDVSVHFTGVALELTPSALFAPNKPALTIRLAALMGTVTGLKRSLSQILLLALVLELIALASPLFLQLVVDKAIVSSDRELVTTMGVGFSLLAILQAGVSALRSWGVMYLSSNLNLQWVSNVFIHLLRLPLPYFEKRHLGDVVSRFESIHTIQRTLTTSFVEACIDGFMAAITLVMMFLYSAALGVIPVIATTLYALFRFVSFRPLCAATQERIIHAARQQGHFLESVRGVQSIQLFGREENRRTTWMNMVVETTNRDIATLKIALGVRLANNLLFGIERVVVIWLGALLVIDNVFSIGMVFAFIAFKEQFTSRVSGLIDKWVEVKMLRLQGERLADIVLTPVAEIAPPEATVTLEMAGALETIEVNGLHFRYGDADAWILDDVSLKIMPGEVVAIVGASGCGKTTLMKLLLGIAAPTRGTIRLGGQDIQRGLADYRSKIAAVMQDDHLFAGSIADNIAFFDPEVSMEGVVKCAMRAAIHDDIVAMPMTYNTLVGDMGAALSGGQKQRILLARALYKRPSILFLDEASSHLDIDTEQIVNASIKALSLTRIIVAHRPETIAMADRVIILKDGKIASSKARQDGLHAVSTSFVVAPNALAENLPERPVF